MDYAQIDNYPDKDFLNDGLYSYTHIFKLGALCRMPDWPIDFHANYTFHHQNWQGNDSGETVPADSHGHILGVGFKAYY